MDFTLKWLAWEITRRCNFACVHCRSSSDLVAAEHPDVPLAEAKRILDDIAAFASPVVVLSGGEPLLRQDLFEIARYGGALGLRMCLATNGSLVTAATCRDIVKANIKMVSLSLDGASPKSHDDFRGQTGAFAGVMRAIELFRGHGIPFLVNSSFTERNQAEIPQVYRLVKSLGATAWYMFMIVPTGRGEDIMAELIPAKMYDELLAWHYRTEKAENELLMRPTCAPHYYRVVRQMAKLEGERFTPRSLQFSTGGSKGCLAGQLICLIDVDGQVLPCSYFPLAAGNIRRQSLRDIWENSELLQKLRDFSAYEGRCGRCEYIQVCGGCRARAYAVTGNYLAEEPFCSYQPGGRQTVKSLTA